MHRSTAGVSYDSRKRPSMGRPADISILSEPLASSSSSAFSRSPPPHPQRTASPPASTYFALLSHDEHAEPQATPAAAQHFAYSSTLRRHGHQDSFSLDLVEAAQQEGPKGVLESIKRTFHNLVGSNGGNRPENGHNNGHEYTTLPMEDNKDTPSTMFAHQSVDDTINYFRTSPTDGLPSSSIPALQSTHGYNELSVSSPESAIIKFIKTIYESPLILLLLGSACISALMGNIDDAVSIAVAILIVLTVGFVQERRSEKSLEALNRLVPHHCHVVRDGKTFHILANDLVPGDVVKLSMGDRVPADLRLIHATDLEIDESSLTGETDARTKRVQEEQGPRGSVGLAERQCVAYMGTLVRHGRGSGVVIATGVQTEFGVIFSMMQDVEEKRTPLQLSMDDLAKNLSILSFAVIAFICFVGVMQHRSWLEMFTIGVSLAVAAIPEGLPVVTTVTLALGVVRMSHRKTIVKKLHCVEALGSVSVICSDKTGTLTKNEQSVTLSYTVDDTVDLTGTFPSSLSPALLKTLDIGAICNNSGSTLDEYGVRVGQSTDVALLSIRDRLGLADPRPNFTRVSEKSFNSERKYMSVSGYHAGNSREIYYIKGSIDAILARCKFYYVTEDSTPTLDAQTRSMILAKAQNVASQGLRVIAMAYGLRSAIYQSSRSQTVLPPSDSADGENISLVFAGFEAMLDPPRKGVADAIGLLQSGGVQVVMITGDAKETALSIARTLGLGSGAAREALEGAEIEQMSASQLAERVGTVRIFARTTPRHKMKIVEAFQARGAVVAMTGDGVNDAPALKMADIGISMGHSGTDVAKEAADAILVDDNFTSILPAIEEGKSIFHNIQNFVSFQLSTAAAALTLITLSTFFSLSNPLNAMQILFINILMDGPPAQSLGVDPVDPAIMRKPPRKKDEPVISRHLLYRVMFSAAIIVAGTLYVYIYALGDENVSRREQTMTFTAFVLLDLVSALQNRSLACPFFANRMLLTTVSVSFITQLGLIYIPLLQSIFQTEALDTADMGMLLGIAATSFILHEGRRRWERARERDVEWTGRVGEMA